MASGPHRSGQGCPGNLTRPGLPWHVFRGWRQVFRDCGCCQFVLLFLSPSFRPPLQSKRRNGSKHSCQPMPSPWPALFFSKSFLPSLLFFSPLTSRPPHAPTDRRPSCTSPFITLACISDPAPLYSASSLFLLLRYPHSHQTPERT